MHAYLEKKNISLYKLFWLFSYYFFMWFGQLSIFAALPAVLAFIFFQMYTVLYFPVPYIVMSKYTKENQCMWKATQRLNLIFIL